MTLVRETPAQLWVTSLKPEIGDYLAPHRMFHVKQGAITRF
jgi:hypothetical protein